MKGHCWFIRRYMNHGRVIKYSFLVQPHHILPSRPIFWSKIDRGVGGTFSELHPDSQNEGDDTFFAQNVWSRPLEGVQRGHVGTFMVILSYAMLSTEYMPTSQIVFAVSIFSPRSPGNSGWQCGDGLVWALGSPQLLF